MKNRIPIITTCLIGAGLLAMATFVSVGQNALAAPPPADPAYTAHSAHVAAAASQPGAQTVEAQLAEMLARIEQLEAITQQQPGHSSPAGTMPMAAGNPSRMKPMPGMGSDAKPMQGGMSGMGRGPAVADQMAELRAKMQRLEAAMQQQSGASSGAMPMQGKMGGMSGMAAGNPPSSGAPGAMKPAGGMSGMGGGASPPGGEMGMMGMMDKMMGMMDKMMGGGAPMPGGGGGMLIPLAYPIVKRIPFLHDRITRHVSLQTLLTVHVYSGIFGPLFAIIHTGHKFDSPLGITLAAVMLLVVVSGFAVRYLLTYINQEIKDKLLLLQTARGDLDSAWGVMENTPPEMRDLPKSPLLAAGLASVGIQLSSAIPRPHPKTAPNVTKPRRAIT